MCGRAAARGHLSVRCPLEFEEAANSCLVTLLVMRMGISLPDTLIEQVDAARRSLGISRTEFFVDAAVRLLGELEASSITAQIDQALALLGDADVAERAAAAGRERLRRQRDRW